MSPSDATRALAKPIRCATLLLWIAASLGCHRPPADNLLFVSFDTTRADHLSVYGYNQPTTPWLDRLAARGVVFERAYSHVPSTLPAHTTIFTGLLPPTHGVRCNGKLRLAGDVPTLAEMLANAGFATAAVLGAFPLERRFGLARGFEIYDDVFASPEPRSGRPLGRTDRPGFWIGHDYLDFERSAAEVTDRAVSWLTGRRPRWFLFVHYFDPHWPYEPQPPWRSRFSLPYDAEIAYADHHLGRLLEAVRRRPGRTLVVFTADHGESLGDHGEMLHNRFVYESTVHVPLIMTLDGRDAHGRRIGTPVGHVDLLPTVLDLLAVPQPPGLVGRSLAPALVGDARLERRTYYLETLVWSLERPQGIEVRAIVDGDHKLIETRRRQGDNAFMSVEVYDLGADSDEGIDRSVQDPLLTARLQRELDQWRTSLESRARSAVSIPVDPAARAKLRSLGYL